MAWRTAAVSAATAGAHEIIAAPSSGRIVLHRLWLAAAGAVTIVLSDGTTALSGAMTLVAGAAPPIDDEHRPRYSQ